MESVNTYDEIVETNQEELPFRAHSFEAEKREIIGSIERAYKLLLEKKTELQELRHEAYCIDDEEESQEKIELKEDIRYICRYIKKLEYEASEIDMLISCRDEKEEPEA